MAREISALVGKPWEPKIDRPKNVLNDYGDIKVDIETSNCPRYSGRLISGVKVWPSPLWLQGRLTALGMRPINNIVDITNYVLMLTGQPIHAFDERKLGKHIVIRQAKNYEKIITLDDVKRKLSPEIMLISTPEKPVAIAGIMGGANSEVDESTENIVVEVAYFNPSTVREGRKLLDLITESSIRFERGTDPNAIPDVSDIVAAMVEDIADAENIYKAVDEYTNPVESELITLTDSKLERLLGKKIPREKSRQILVCLGMDIAGENAGGVTYRIPTFRPDLNREVDLVEEVGRIYGLNNIEPLFRAQGEIPAHIPQLLTFRHFLEDLLRGLGYNYALTDPLGSKQIFEKFAENELVELSNPVSDDLVVMRPNPLPTLISAVARNLNRGMWSVRLFEIDFGYAKIAPDYSETNYISIAGGGYRYPIGWDYPEMAMDIFDIKGTVEVFLNKLGEEIVFQPGKSDFAMNGTFANILLSKRITSTMPREMGQISVVPTVSFIKKPFDITPRGKEFFKSFGKGKLGLKQKIIPKTELKPPVESLVPKTKLAKITEITSQKIAPTAEKSVLGGILITKTITKPKIELKPEPVSETKLIIRQEGKIKPKETAKLKQKPIPSPGH